MYMIFELNVDEFPVETTLHRIVNQIYRLLPLREEGEDWKKPLSTLIIELTGFFELFPNLSEGIRALNKLQGMLMIGDDLDFYEYRRTIFECCSIVSSLEKELSA